MRAQATDGSIVSAYVREAVRRAEEERPGRLLLSLWLSPEPAHTITCKMSSVTELTLLQLDSSRLPIQPSGLHAELMLPESVSAAGERSAVGTDWSSCRCAAAMATHALLA